MNGKLRDVGMINLQSVQEKSGSAICPASLKPRTGKGEFKMCLVDSADYSMPVTGQQFVWTLYDIDSRYHPDNTFAKPPYFHERVRVNTNVFKEYQLWTGSKVTVVAPNDRTVFTSSVPGEKRQAHDPKNLTDKQLSVSIAFTFQDTSCFTMEYDHFCPGYELEQGYDENTTPCHGAKRQGAKILFGIGCDNLNRTVLHPECAPSDAPSLEPLSPTKLPSYEPSDEPSIAPSDKPSNSPSSGPTTKPSSAPSDKPSNSPSSGPTTEPSSAPSDKPSNSPSRAPSDKPSNSPSRAPSDKPSSSPSAGPTTEAPTSEPDLTADAICDGFCQNDGGYAGQGYYEWCEYGECNKPWNNDDPNHCEVQDNPNDCNENPAEGPITCRLCCHCNGLPSMTPSSAPSNLPSVSPSAPPSVSPSSTPSAAPSLQPTPSPSIPPSEAPSATPSLNPSDVPSMHPSVTPSSKPSGSPSSVPSDKPSSSPSAAPSVSPSLNPSEVPSMHPSVRPSPKPSGSPSSVPSDKPSGAPSPKPSGSPSSVPSDKPSGAPSDKPSPAPSDKPSVSPTNLPSFVHSMIPSAGPSPKPSGSPSSSPSAMPSITCPCQDGSTFNFEDSTLRFNTLHEAGGNLTYDGIGIIGGRNVSLVITEESGFYQNITDVWSSYTGNCTTDNRPDPLNSTDMNGKLHDVGMINLQSVQEKSGSAICPASLKPRTGKGEFKMCLVDSADYSMPVTGQQFVWTLYDIDSRFHPENTFAKPPYFHERVRVNTNTFKEYQLWPGSNVTVVAPNDRTVFTSTVPGARRQAHDPKNLTDQQLSVSIAFTLQDTSCFTMEYEHFCPGYELEQGYDDNTTPCHGAKRQGAKILFGIGCDNLNQTVLHPECAPSDAPSLHPSSPTQLPSYEPSDEPSIAPSDKPSNSPSSGPITKPSSAPSDMPSNSPSSGPTPEPSSAPSDKPSNSPSSTVSDKPSNSPSSPPSDKPSSSPSAGPTTLEPTALGETDCFNCVGLCDSFDSVFTGEQEMCEDGQCEKPWNNPDHCEVVDEPTCSYCQAVSGGDPDSCRLCCQCEASPSTSPSSAPTDSPSVSPSAPPSVSPSSTQTEPPSLSVSPTSVPSVVPSMHPSVGPSLMPSECLCVCVSDSPSVSDAPSSKVQPSTAPTTLAPTFINVSPGFCLGLCGQFLSDWTGEFEPCQVGSCTEPWNNPDHCDESVAGRICCQCAAHPSDSPSSLPTVRPSNEPAYFVVCGKGTGCREGDVGIALVSELHEVRCCKDEFAPGFNTNKCDNVWAASDLGGCHTEKTYSEANVICEDYISRLCTRAEISDQCTRGSGCSLDHRLIWSSTPVPHGPTPSPVTPPPVPEYYVVCGKGDGCREGNEDVALASDLHEVRCCRDENAPGFKARMCNNIWAASELDGCHSEQTHAEAMEICQEYNSRLCTRTEISDQCTRGSGCKFDGHLIWSSTLTVSPSPVAPSLTNVPSDPPADSASDFPTDSPSDSPLADEPEYYAVCGKGSGCPEGNEDITFASELHEVRCCRDEYASGFETNRCDNIWAASNLGGCHSEQTHAEATGICQDNNSRLCTRAEISGQCTRGSGCSFDNRLIWSSTPNAYYVVCGKGGACIEQSAFVHELHNVRCCKDEYASGFETNKCDNVWAASDLGGCHSEQTFAEAEAICQENDSRICTLAEISDQCTRGSGCSFDNSLIWSITPVE